MLIMMQNTRCLTEFVRLYSCTPDLTEGGLDGIIEILHPILYVLLNSTDARLQMLRSMSLRKSSVRSPINLYMSFLLGLVLSATVISLRHQPQPTDDSIRPLDGQNAKELM
ncbi:hypothetical protein QQ045_032342 [Rhodiola kirilowii]